MALEVFIANKGQRVNSKYSKLRRNAPCPCGSGKKYKACHGAFELGQKEIFAEANRRHLQSVIEATKLRLEEIIDEKQ